MILTSDPPSPAIESCTLKSHMMQLGHLAPTKAGLDFPRHKTEGIDPGESQRYTKLAPPFHHFEST